MTSGASPRGEIDGILRDGLLAGVSAADLAAEFGTPLYVYDLDLIGQRIDTLRAALPRGFRLAYAVKANPALGVLTHVAGTGIGADIASGGELEAVLRAGFDAGGDRHDGPGQARRGACERPSPPALASSPWSRPGSWSGWLPSRPVWAAASRCCCAWPSRRSRFERVSLISGAEGKFGMPLPVLREAALRAAASPNLELLGLHAFGASNLLDAGRLADHVTELVAVAREVAVEAGVSPAPGGRGRRAGHPLRRRRAAAGPGGPGVAAGGAASRLGRGRDRCARPRSCWSRAAGSWGRPGLCCCASSTSRATAQAPVAILDGGINNAVRPALVRTEQRLALLMPDAASRERVPVIVAGPLCTGLDVLARGAVLPRPRPGDLVAMLDAGAYGFTESMPLFLSHPTAAEVAVRGGQARLIRPGISPGELLDRQIVPRW